MFRLAIPFRGAPFVPFQGGESGPGPGPSTLILDEFTDTNGTALGSHTIAPINTPGNGWTVSPGAADVQSNRANAATYASGEVVVITDAEVSDFTVSAIVNMSAGSANGVIGRYVDDNNYWLAHLNEGTDGLELYEKAGGSYTLRAQSPTLTIDPSTDYTVSMTMLGGNISATLDGAHEITYTSVAKMTATKVGLRFGGAGTNRADDFTVEPNPDLYTLTYVGPNPHPGSFDECAVHALDGTTLYWTSHRITQPDGNGYEYTLDGMTIATIDTQAGKAMWNAVISSGKVYAVGQAYDAGDSQLRSCTALIDTADDSVTKTLMKETGAETDDLNELIAILDDGTNIVAGEGGANSVTGTTDFPNASGIWTLPKATFTNAATYTRVYEDAHTHWTWYAIRKYGSTYYGLLTDASQSGANIKGKYEIKHSSNLTSWTVDIDGTALNLNDIRGCMIKHTGQNKLYAAVPNASRQVVLREFNGTSWSATTLDITVGSTNLYFLTLHEVGDYLVLMVSDWTARTYDIYRLSNLSGTPALRLLVAGLAGAVANNDTRSSGNTLYYGVSYADSGIHQLVLT